jgi:anti-anti-sigma factor
MEGCLVLNLSEVDAIDATGLGLLVELHCRAQSRHQRLRIMEPSACVRRLIELVNLESVLDVVAVDEGRLCGDGETRSPYARGSLTA